MNQDEDAVPRKKRRAKAADEPHHASRRSTKKKRPLAWYQHLSIAIPLAACVLFAVLIVGTIAARRVIYQVHQPIDPSSAVIPVSDEPAAALSPTKIEEPSVAEVETSPLDHAPPQSAEVAAVVADQKQGMKLSKMLLVGPGKDMLPTITEALKLAGPGDVIEVRTNGPLLELGTELKREARIENAPITIRNGDGFQPVIRAGWTGFGRGLVIAKNVDFILSGLHCVSNRSTNLLHVTRGHLIFRDCSFNCPDSTAMFTAIAWDNFESRFTKNTDIFQTAFERCFFRNSNFCGLYGARLAISLTECGFIGLKSPSLISVTFDEQHHITINRCSFINSHLLRVTMSKAFQAVGPPITYQINQSVLGNVGFSTMVIEITAAAGFQAKNATDALDKLQDIMHFEGSNSVRQLAFAPQDPPVSLGTWGSFSGVFLTDITRIPTLPKIDQSLKFGPGIEEMRRLSMVAKDSAAAVALSWTLMPDQLATTSTGPLAELRNLGIQVGCNVDLLPMPPPATLEPYLPGQ